MKIRKKNTNIIIRDIRIRIRANPIYHPYQEDDGRTTAHRRRRSRGRACAAAAGHGAPEWRRMHDGRGTAAGSSWGSIFLCRWIGRSHDYDQPRRVHTRAHSTRRSPFRALTLVATPRSRPSLAPPWNVDPPSLLYLPPPAACNLRERRERGR